MDLKESNKVEAIATQEILKIFKEWFSGDRSLVIEGYSRNSIRWAKKKSREPWILVFILREM